MAPLCKRWRCRVLDGGHEEVQGRPMVVLQSLGMCVGHAGYRRVSPSVGPAAALWWRWTVAAPKPSASSAVHHSFLTTRLHIIRQYNHRVARQVQHRITSPLRLPASHFLTLCFIFLLSPCPSIASLPSVSIADSRMADSGGGGDGGGDADGIRDQDRLLPIANISRIMKRVLPDHAKMSKESKSSIQEVPPPTPPLPMA